MSGSVGGEDMAQRRCEDIEYARVFIHIWSYMHPTSFLTPPSSVSKSSRLHPDTLREPKSEAQLWNQLLILGAPLTSGSMPLKV